MDALLRFVPARGGLRADRVACFAILIAARVASAAQLYVSPTGSNANSGTSTVAAWQTLQYAADHVGRGDRVNVLPGNYTGFYLGDKPPGIAPIEFIAEPGVVITQRNAITPDGINVEATSYVTIDGFTVNNMPRAGVRAAAFPEDNMNHVTIRNIHADHNGIWGIFTGFVDDLLIENNVTSRSVQEHGIYVSNSADRPILRGNESWGNHGSGIHMNGDAEQEGGDGIISGAMVSRNLIHDNAQNGGGGSGINMDGVQDSRIEGNLLYGNLASGISLYAIDGAEGSSGNIVVNNTIHMPSESRWALNIQDESTGARVFNNILLHDERPAGPRGSIDIEDDSLPGLLSDYNLVADVFTTTGGDELLDFAEWKSNYGQDAHSKLAASLGSIFVNAAAGDYHLVAGSPALNAGVPTLAGLSAPTIDIEGAVRPQGVGFDIGAFERSAGPTADFTGDGQVTGDDLAAWKTGFPLATGASHAQGDADGDQDVDGADLLAWQRQANPPGQGPIPEPSALVSLTTALALLATTRRQRQAAFLHDPA